MMGYAQRTKGYRIWLIGENKLVETINVRFDENKRGINFRQKVNSNLGYNLNPPDYYDDEDDFDRVKDSLTSRLVSKTSTETPSTSEKPDVSSDNYSLIHVQREIGQRVGRNQATVMWICHRWMREETSDRRGRSHPPRCTTDHDDRQIVRMAETDRVSFDADCSRVECPQVSLTVCSFVTDGYF
ncbi:uncharacterized protein TNCV_2257981 [Trichonephila clavipes]|nr:uncharacterized protein TNCV_2257981 [Trichonephila clavipes]